MKQLDACDAVNIAAETIRSLDANSRSGDADLELNLSVSNLLRAYTARLDVQRQDQLPYREQVEAIASQLMSVMERQRREYNPGCICDRYADLPGHSHGEHGCEASNENRYCLCLHRGQPRALAC